MLKHCSSIHDEHMPRAMLEQCPTYVTNVQTYNSCLLEHSSHQSNARRGAEQIDQPRHEIPPAAADGFTSLRTAIAEIGHEFRPHDCDHFDVVRTRHDQRRRPIPQRIRRLVHVRDNWQCIWCATPDPLQIDHIVPWSAGGSDDIDNLRTLCASCNAYRRNRGFSLDLSCFQIPHGHTCIECDAATVGRSSTVEPIFCITCEHKALGIPPHPGYTAYFRGPA
jgi:HNH endonuclease